MESTAKVTLYRGDSIPFSGGTGAASKAHRGRTFAEHFLGTGLMARHADGGRPSDVGRRDLIDLVLEHVGYDRHGEEATRAYHSPLISFSTSQEIGMTFANRSMNDLERCDFEDASYFLWRFEVELVPWKHAGSYCFEYRADPVNCSSLAAEQLARAMPLLDDGDLWPFGKALGAQIALAHAAVDTHTHVALIVDVAVFLQGSDLARRDQRLVKNALDRSMRDDEWLVMPADAMEDGRGFDARLHMNARLFAEAWFRAKTSRA